MPITRAEFQKGVTDFVADVLERRNKVSAQRFLDFLEANSDRAFMAAEVARGLAQEGLSNGSLSEAQDGLDWLAARGIIEKGDVTIVVDNVPGVFYASKPPVEVGSGEARE